MKFILKNTVLEKRIRAHEFDCLWISCPLMLSMFLLVFNSSRDLTTIYNIVLMVLLTLSVGFGYIGMIGKDLVNKRSPGKRKYALKIVAKNGKDPTFWQLVVRNIFLFAWPIEIIPMLAGRQRIGDILAKTAIIEEDADVDDSLFSDFKLYDYLLIIPEVLFIALFAIVLFMIIVGNLRILMG